MRERRGARVAALGLDGGGSSSGEDEEGWSKGALGRLMSGKGSSDGYAKGRLNERWKERGRRGGTRAAAGFTDSQAVGRGPAVRGAKVKVEKQEDDEDIMAPILRFREKEKGSRNTSSSIPAVGVKVKQEQASDTDTPSDDDLDAPVHSFRTPSVPPLSSISSFTNNRNQAKLIKRRDSIPPSTASTATSFSSTTTTSTSHTASAPQSRATSFSKIVDLDDDPLFTLPKPLEKSSTYRGKSMAARRRVEGENSRNGTGGEGLGDRKEKERERRLFDSLKSF